MSYSADYGRGIAYRALATALTLTVAGCATRGRVRTLEDEVEKLGAQVRSVEQKPLAEGPITVTKSQNPVEFGMLLGQLLNQYADRNSREMAEKHGNIIALFPTNDQRKYYAVVHRDTNDDAKVTRDQDRTYPDGTGHNIRIGFDLNSNNLPQNVRDWLLNARSR